MKVKQAIEDARPIDHFYPFHPILRIKTQKRAVIVVNLHYIF